MGYIFVLVWKKIIINIIYKKRVGVLFFFYWNIKIFIEELEILLLFIFFIRSIGIFGIFIEYFVLS